MNEQDDSITVDPNDLVELQQQRIHQLSDENVMLGALIRKLRRDAEELRTRPEDSDG